MKTKGKVSRVTAFIMTLLMAVSLLCATAFAIEPNATGTIKVEGVENGVTVSAYRLMDVKVNENGQPQEPVYTWTGAVADWVRENYPNYIGAADASAGTEDNSVQEAFSTAAEAGDIAEFYDKLAAAIKTTAGPLHITAEGTRVGSGTIEDLHMGNYLILIENGMKVYRPSAVNLVPVWDEGSSVWVMSDAAVDVKSSEPSISKTVNADTGSDSAGKEADNANIGDTVAFEIVADVPKFPANALAKNYAVSDILPEGLTLDEDSIEVYGVSGEAEDLLAAGDGGAYTPGNVRPNSGGKSSFTLTFDYDKISTYGKIRVTYSAVLNGGAVLGASGNVNNAYLDYSNNPYVAGNWKEKPDSAAVYTYGIDISKVDKGDHENFLAGAEFELYASKDAAEAGTEDAKISFVKVSEGVYRRALAEEQGTTTTLVVGKNGDLKGRLTVKGLDEGTWYLKETKAPGGYNLLAAPVKVVVTDADTESDALDGQVTGAAADASGEAAALVTLTVENDNGFRLPVTGGAGTVLFAVGGAVLMSAAVICFIAVSKRKNA